MQPARDRFKQKEGEATSLFRVYLFSLWYPKQNSRDPKLFTVRTRLLSSRLSFVVVVVYGGGGGEDVVVVVVVRVVVVDPSRRKRRRKTRARR